MSRLARLAAVIPAAAVPAWGAGTGQGEEGGLLAYAFLGFAAIIVVFQTVPGLIMLCSMLRELFGVRARNGAEEGAGKR